MPSHITLPDGYEYIAAALLSTCFLLTGQSIVVGRHRKLAGVPYPQLYAEKAEAAANPAALKFNCAQRAHQNTLENISTLYVLTGLTALQSPKLAAGLCAAWVVGRVLYTRGYLQDVKKRNSSGGILGSLALGSLLLSATYTVGSLLVAKL